jgi:hypothetical protein
VGSEMCIRDSYRTYGIVSIARHIESGMYVAIKKFKESDDNEYVNIYALIHLIK